MKLQNTVEQVKNDERKMETIVVSLADLAKAGVITAGDVVGKLLQASTVNPYLGVVSGWILGDLLQKAGLITPNTNLLIKGAGLTIIGVDVAAAGSEIIQGILSDIDPIAALSNLFSGSKVPTEILQPTATTIVFPNEQGLQDLIAKLPSLNKAP